MIEMVIGPEWTGDMVTLATVMMILLNVFAVGFIFGYVAGQKKGTVQR